MQKRSSWILSLSLLLLLCSNCTRIRPGYVGIKINNSGSYKGVSDIPVVTGWQFYIPGFSTILEYPVFVQTAVWSKSPNEGKPTNEEITFTSGDQMQVAADISLAYRLDASAVPTFYVTFRSDDLAIFTHGYLRNMAREKFDNVAGKYKIEQIMGDNGPFLSEVRKDLQDSVKPLGVEIMQFGFIGAPRPPGPVIEAINAKVQATQAAMKAENEVRRSEAEARKVVVEAEGAAKANVARADGEAKAAIARAEGQAKGNDLINRSITEKVIQWRELELRQKWIEQWGGTVPSVMGSQGGLLLDMRALEPSTSKKK